MAYRILVVDDDRQIVRLVRSYLEQAGMTALIAYEGEAAMHMIRRERPDLIVLDVMLPGISGWQITKQLRADEHLASIPVLMLTARVEDSDKINGLELGADDYLTKPFNPQEVVARVKAILRRANGVFTPPHILESSGLRLDADSRLITVDGRLIDVTPTEFAMLHMLMENANHVITRAELINQVFGYSYDGTERTIDTHIKNLRKKIEEDPAQPRYIETVFGVGYCLREHSLREPSLREERPTQ